MNIITPHKWASSLGIRLNQSTLETKPWSKHGHLCGFHNFFMGQYRGDDGHGRHVKIKVIKQIREFSAERRHVMP